jgi:hypothetical protein
MLFHSKNLKPPCILTLFDIYNFMDMEIFGKMAKKNKRIEERI